MMETFGQQIRKLREQKGEPLRVIAGNLGIDSAILSKIENGKRQATRDQVEKLACYFDVDTKNLLVNWLSERVSQELEGLEYAEQVLKVAEERVAYEKHASLDREALVEKIIDIIKKDNRILKAWVFGSFAREDDKPNSDIDLLIADDRNQKFNYFDLAELQHNLKQSIGKKVDIGFVDSLRENLSHLLKTEAKLIYER